MSTRMTNNRLAVLVAAFVAPFALACSSKSDPKPAGDAGAAGDTANTITDTMAATMTDTGAEPVGVIGAFDIRLVPGDPGSADSAPVPAFVAIQGRVASAPQPPLLTLETTAREGDCLVEVPKPQFCDACLDGTCVKGGKCVPNPQPRSVGTVTVTGVATAAGSSLSMAPQPPKYFYQPEGEVKITVPPFEEGAALKLAASGGELPAFEIAGKGTTMLEVTTTTPVTMERGKPLGLRWKAATVAGISRVGIVVDISHHGGFAGQIRCDVADSGSFDVPAAMVGKLIDLGVAGYPSTTVTRKTTGETTLSAGRVQLNVTTERLLPIVIPGYVSCSEKEPCAAGKTCSQAGLCQ
jgi:hypothetical protein